MKRSKVIGIVSAVGLAGIATAQQYYTVDYANDRLLMVTVTGPTATAVSLGSLGVNVTEPPDLTRHEGVLYMTANVAGAIRIYQVVTSGVFVGQAIGGMPLNVSGNNVAISEGLTSSPTGLLVSYGATSSSTIGSVDATTGLITNPFALPFDGDGLCRIGSTVWAVDGAVTGGNRTFRRTGNTTWALQSTWTNSDYDANDLVNHNSTSVIGTGNRVGSLLTWSKTTNNVQSFIPITGFTSIPVGGIAEVGKPCIKNIPQPNSPWPLYVTVDVNGDSNIQWAGTLTHAGVFRYFKNRLVPAGQEITNPDLTWFKDNVYMVSKIQSTGRFRFDQILTDGAWQGLAVGNRPVNFVTPINHVKALTSDSTNFYVGFGVGTTANLFGTYSPVSNLVTPLGPGAVWDNDGMCWDGSNFYGVDIIANTNDQLWQRPPGATSFFTFTATIPSANNDVNDLEWSYLNELAGISGYNWLYRINKISGTVSFVRIGGDISNEDQSLWGLCRYLECAPFEP